MRSANVNAVNAFTELVRERVHTLVRTRSSWVRNEFGTRYRYEEQTCKPRMLLLWRMTCSKKASGIPFKYTSEPGQFGFQPLYIYFFRSLTLTFEANSIRCCTVGFNLSRYIFRLQLVSGFKSSIRHTFFACLSSLACFCFLFLFFCYLVTRIYCTRN